MAGSSLAVAVIAVTATCAVAVAAIAPAATAAQRVAGIADAAALAAADAASGAIGGFPCERAAQIAGSQGATLVECTLEDLVATITVTAVHGPFPVAARSRAGPPP